MKLTVTGRYGAECILSDYNRERPTHLISCHDPDAQPLDGFIGFVGPKLECVFHDVTVTLTRFRCATEDDIAAMIRFAHSTIDETARLLVHCEEGRNRSTAAAFIVLCALWPARPEAEILPLIGLARCEVNARRPWQPKCTW